MTTIRTNSQNKLLHYLLGVLKISAEVKEDLVYQFTGGRETRSNGMSPDECQRLINHLNALKKQVKTSNVKEAKTLEVGQETLEVRKWIDPDLDKLRKKVIAQCHDMKMQIPGTVKIDMARVNDLCIKRGYLHKKLDDYTKAELPTLITQVQKMARDFLKGNYA